MTTTPPLDLDEIEARAAALYEYATVADQEGQDALNELTDTDVPALLAEVRRLRAVNEQLDRSLGETIDDRDQAHEIADKLAYAVAPIEVIGEHSSMNCPWTNALDLITPAAEVDKLRGDRAAAWRDLADRADPAHEASWFGDFGHMVGGWIRQQAEYEARAARPAAVAAAGDTDEANA